MSMRECLTLWRGVYVHAHTCTHRAGVTSGCRSPHPGPKSTPHQATLPERCLSGLAPG